jgi:hypothetical protein
LVNNEPGGTRTADAVVAWLLFALQVGGELFLGMFWVMSVMMTDSCGSVVDEPRVCDGEYFATWFFAYAAVLVAGLLVTPIAIVVAGRRGKLRWPWPAFVIVLLIAATIGYVWAFTR